MKTITVRVSAWMWERLRDEARGQGRSIASHLLYRAGALEPTGEGHAAAGFVPMPPEPVGVGIPAANPPTTP